MSVARSLRTAGLMQRGMNRLVIALLGVVVGACGSEEAGAPPPLLGRWRQLPNALDPSPTPVESRRVLTFNADGTLLDEQGPVGIRGSFEASATELTTIDAGIILTEGYVVSADDQRLLLRAMPRTSGTPSAGVWRGDWIEDGISHGMLVEPRSDRTAHVANYIDDRMVDDFEGTWTRADDDLAVFLPAVNETYYGTFVEAQLGVPYERM